MRAGWFESLTELQGRFVGVLEEKIHPYGIWVWCSGWLHESHGSECCDHTSLMLLPGCAAAIENAVRVRSV